MELRSSSLQGKHSTDCTIFPAQKKQKQKQKNSDFRDTTINISTDMRSFCTDLISYPGGPEGLGFHFAFLNLAISVLENICKIM